jgi:hypothetical protein
MLDFYARETEFRLSAQRLRRAAVTRAGGNAQQEYALRSRHEMFGSTLSGLHRQQKVDGARSHHETAYKPKDYGATISFFYAGIIHTW